MNKVLALMQGMGDTVYARPIVRSYVEQGNPVFVQTSWPELFEDMDVQVLPVNTSLRTQARNLERWGGSYASHPSQFERVHLHYTIQDLRKDMTIMRSLGSPKEYDFSLSLELPEVPVNEPYMIVHPPTMRREWMNEARPCDPMHIQTLIDAFPQFKPLQILDIVAGEEWIYGDPLRDTYLLPPLTTRELIAYMKGASLIVTGVGFMLPLGIALRTPTVCIWGGDLPERVLVEPQMGLELYRGVAPNPMCECGLNNRHRRNECNRRIEKVRLIQAAEEVLCARVAG